MQEGPEDGTGLGLSSGAFPYSVGWLWAHWLIASGVQVSMEQ